MTLILMRFALRSSLRYGFSVLQETDDDG